MTEAEHRKMADKAAIRWRQWSRGRNTLRLFALEDLIGVQLEDAVRTAAIERGIEFVYVDWIQPGCFTLHNNGGSGPLLCFLTRHLIDDLVGIAIEHVGTAIMQGGTFVAHVYTGKPDGSKQ